MENRFRVMQCDLNLLYHDNVNHSMIDDVIGERINAWGAFALALRTEKHDHATWVVHISTGRVMPNIEYANAIVSAIEDQEDAANVNYTPHLREYYAKRARKALFKLIGDGRPEEEVDCEPILYKRVWVDQSEYMGDGYWADYPPMEFDTYDEALTYVNLVNAVQQTGGGEMKTRPIRVQYV